MSQDNLPNDPVLNAAYNSALDKIFLTLSKNHARLVAALRR